MNTFETSPLTSFNTDEPMRLGFRPGFKLVSDAGWEAGQQVRSILWAIALAIGTATYAASWIA